MQNGWRDWRSKADAAPATAPEDDADGPLWKMRASLRGLLEDPRVPASVRRSLEPEYRQVEAMLEKIEHGHVHIAAFGRVSVGKSSLLNALLGEARFEVSPLHGATRTPAMGAWPQARDGGVFFIDTPGIDEIDGEALERVAHEVAERSDLVLFVVEADLTATEMDALRMLATEGRPLLLVLNKADRYTGAERHLLLDALAQRAAGLVASGQIVACAARPAEQVLIQQDADGSERELRRARPPDVAGLQERLWQILEREGQALAALNAGLFAGRLSEQVARRITEVRRDVAARVIRAYCLAKGVAVALTPVPVADLAAAAALDVTLVVHLSRVYGLPATRREAGSLIRTVLAQMVVLMGAAWTVHLFASALKGLSAGLSTALTAGAQGAVAYAMTHVVGRAAQRYYAQGGAWGPGGPRRVVQDILKSVDRDTLLHQARADIRAHLAGRRS